MVLVVYLSIDVFALDIYSETTFTSITCLIDNGYVLVRENINDYRESDAISIIVDVILQKYTVERKVCYLQRAF